MLFVLVLGFYFCNQEIGVTKTTLDIIEICDAYILMFDMFRKNDQQYLDFPSWSGMVVFLHYFTKILSYTIAKRDVIIFHKVETPSLISTLKTCVSVNFLSSIFMIHGLITKQYITPQQT